MAARRRCLRGQKKVAAWLGTATQQLRELLPRLAEELIITILISSLRRLVRRLGYTWKRCRRSLKAQRDPLAFAACPQQLHTLHQAEQRGAVAVFYADECRFSRQAPVPYAWQVRGQPPVELPAVRGRGGCSVLGFWQAGVVRQPVVAYQRAGSFPADLFALAVDEFSRTLTGPTVLVLDNASIHRAHLVRAYWDTRAERGLSLLFLPAYSPELNRIEVLWHRCKHYWVKPEHYRDEDTLFERVEYVLNHVGSIHTVTFA